jgi:CheY-like chemotaxis protein
MKKKYRILIVEDEMLTARCLYEDLKDLGLNPLVPVPKGETAVEVALKEKPDLILMDICLAGGMDGIEAAEAVHKKYKIPVIFMSGFTTEYILKKAEAVNYITFLEKPVTVEILDSTISQLKNGKYKPHSHHIQGLPGAREIRIF